MIDSKNSLFFGQTSLYMRVSLIFLYALKSKLRPGLVIVDSIILYTMLSYREIHKVGNSKLSAVAGNIICVLNKVRVTFIRSNLADI